MEGEALRKSVQIPQELVTRPSAALTSQVTEKLATQSQVLPVCSGGSKPGSSQPWECSSCQSGKLNELVMERKMPHHFKARLNPGCLIVPSCSPTPFQAGSHCPMNGPDWLATSGRCRAGQLMVKLDPKLNTEKSMSFSCVALLCWRQPTHPTPEACVRFGEAYCM